MRSYADTRRLRDCHNAAAGGRRSDQWGNALRSRDARARPELLITAKTTRGPGVFGDVTFIQRLATVGGVAPATACTAGATTSVSYTAVYRFFKKS